MNPVENVGDMFAGAGSESQRLAAATPERAAGR